MDTQPNEPAPALTPSATPTPTVEEASELRRQRLIIIGIAVLAVIVLGVFITGLFFLLSPERTSLATVTRITNVFIIVMALESLIIGLALIILMVQVARLTNLLENEVKPILDSTNETVSTLRGTTKFLSNNLVEPVIKLNEYIAGFQRMTEIFHITRKEK